MACHLTLDASTFEAFARVRAQTRQPTTEPLPEVREAYLDALALEARARREGIHRTPAFRHAMELLESKLLSREWMARQRALLPAPVAPTEADTAAWYEQHPQSYRLTPHFTARHLLVLAKGNPAFPARGLETEEAKARAEEALGRLEAGAGWDAVARDYSEDSGTRNHGGLLEQKPFGFQPPEVEAQIRTLPLGRPSAPIRSTLGWHVVQVEGRVLEGTRQPLAEVRDEIARRLLEERGAARDEAILGPARSLRGMKLRPAATRRFPTGPGDAIPESEPLAELDGKPITEGEFQWFFRDAHRLSQRQAIMRRPGTRPQLVAAFLELRLEAAMARAAGLDQREPLMSLRPIAELNLLGEFLLEREGRMPWQAVPGAEARESRRAYLDRLRKEEGIQAVAPDSGPGGTQVQ